MAIRKRPASTTPTKYVQAETIQELIAQTDVNRNCGEQVFGNFLRLYNQRDPDKLQGLSGVSMYIYRGFPKIDFRQANKSRHSSAIEIIHCVNADGDLTELPEDIRRYILEKHGSGKYRIHLCDKRSPRNNDGNQVCLCSIHIDDTERPAIVDPKELVETDPETATWITRQLSLGLLARDAEGRLCLPSEKTGPQTPEQAAFSMARTMITQQAANNGANEHAERRTVDLLANTYERLLERAAGPDPVQTFTALAQILKGSNGSAGGDSTAAILGFMGTMMQQQQTQALEMFKLQVEMMRQREPAQPAAPVDTQIEALDRLMNFVGKIGPTQKSSWWDDLKGLLPTLLPVFMARAGTPPALAAQTAQMLAANLNSPAPHAAAPPGGIDTGAGFIPAPGPGLTPQQSAELAARAYACMMRGQTGDQFAEAIEVWTSPELYRTIHSLGRSGFQDVLLNSTYGDGFRKEAVALSAFVDKFFSYDEPEPAAQPGAAA